MLGPSLCPHQKPGTEGAADQDLYQEEEADLRIFEKN